MEELLRLKRSVYGSEYLQMSALMVSPSTPSSPPWLLEGRSSLRHSKTSSNDRIASFYKHIKIWTVLDWSLFQHNEQAEFCQTRQNSTPSITSLFSRDIPSLLHHLSNSFLQPFYTPCSHQRAMAPACTLFFVLIHDLPPPQQKTLFQ